jgi:ribosomal protein S18 acetylase RimI-like enzyme
MPQITDRATIRAILETDRPWAVYALADLQPGAFEHSTWFHSDGGAPAVGLVYSGFATTVLITLGHVAELEAILREIDEALDPHELYAVVRPEVVALLSGRYELAREKAMHRMVLDRTQHHVIATKDVIRLDTADLEAVQRLYADGEANGESPDWFVPEMLAHGVYYGIREAGELVTVAGTHVVAVQESVGCLGNIYTRRDRRGRGLGTWVTRAVTAQLGDMGLRTIALNVQENNTGAIRVYEKLGFRRYCAYVEALARKRREHVAGESSGINSL